jgi:AcrR family transcriptional regulator
MALREEGKERRRQRILDAVMEILREDGFSGLSVAKIADRARVSVATLYNLIGPLDEIVGAMVERMFKEFEAIRLEPNASENPIDGIYRFVDATVEHFEEDPERFRSMHRAIFQLNVLRGLSKPAFHAAERNQQAIRDLIEEAIRVGLVRPNVNPERLAEQMLTGQMSLLQAWSIALIPLARYQLSCRLLFATLLRAWATRKLIPRLNQEIEVVEAALEQGE